LKEIFVPDLTDLHNPSPDSAVIDLILRADVTPAFRVVLLTILRHGPLVSQDEIAQRARVSLSTVKNAIEELVRLGFLAYERDGSGRTRTHYKIQTERLTDAANI
jgi:DNA-binding MarR family transcriptional regulator